MIRVLIPCYNVGEWIERCLTSVVQQVDADFTIYVIDDASTDDTHERLNRWLLNEKLPLTVYRNGVNQKCPRNLWENVPRTGDDPDDVIFLLDGDDFLPHQGVLAYVAERYRDSTLWLSYGQYRPEPHDTGQVLAQRYPPEVMLHRSFRSYGLNLFNHPLIFRRFLWDNAVEEADLKTSTGEWFTGGYDLTIMLPLLETAGPAHVEMFDEVLYCYNAVNPASESSAHVWRVEQSREVFDRPVKPQLVK